MSSLFTPLAEKFRPQSLCEMMGQELLLKENSFLHTLVLEKRPLSLLLWGPPGTGKTTLANIYCKSLGLEYMSFSAVLGSIAEIKKRLTQLETHPLFSRGPLVVFVDEIHRFNKAQQDAFLPYLEKGTIILIGATTENPSFSLNNALLSRLRVLSFSPLDDKALSGILQKVYKTYPELIICEKVEKALIEMAMGDARYLLNLIENLLKSPEKDFRSIEKALPWLQKRPANFDRQSDQHYQLISALHKALRGSDPQASLYWLARMLDGGVDPLFIIRRLIRVACEDIGLADPESLKLATSTKNAYEHLGSPEGDLAIAELTLYLAMAPKSNACYMAFKKAQELASKTGHLSPPKSILNASTNFLKEQGFGKGYCYDHDYPYHISGQNYFPQGLEDSSFYVPGNFGFEKELEKRLDFFSKFKKQDKSS